MKKLFTPGPLNTSTKVKQAMLMDVGSRDIEFINAVKEIRIQLLHLANVNPNNYSTVIIQGSGTFGVESVISSALKPTDTLLVLINGAYGERILRIANTHKINTEVLRFEENEQVNINDVEAILKQKSNITHIAIIHSETTTGLFNPIEEIGELSRKYNKTYIVDAMSSFGGVKMEIEKSDIDFLISSSNKCIEGVPGFSFAICKTNSLKKCEANAKTVSLDLYEQWKGLEQNGQFRFTPPTLAIMAFQQAINELIVEGGVVAREQRYKNNQRVLLEGTRALGLEEYLPREIQGHIINSFLYPKNNNFNFDNFYKKLNEKGCVIYPGKLSKVDAFRIGNIGQLYEEDMKYLVNCMEEILTKKKITATV
ncbi:MAG: 2-aminoethylphosphonate--pyruvate transaminase [Bacteroidota bacterium]|nr:2-aminoethylphosphonate--pyruvate transaminase [Bacteroidota bacterium]